MGAVAEFKALSSMLMERLNWANLAGLTFGGRRNLYQVLGYKRQLDYADYRDRYARDGIAKSVVEAYPLATWRGGVEIYEDEDPDVTTTFETAFKEFSDRLGFWQTCQQVDILAGLSTYAILLIGVADGSDLNTELPNGNGSPDDIIFLKPFSGGGGPGGDSRSRSQAINASVSIARYDVDPTSERYGEPAFYSIRPPNIGAAALAREVHWSRVIHIAEGCLEDNVFGAPTLENVFNLFDDLAKVTGGGAEAHWLRANQGLHLDVDKDMGLPGQTSGGLTEPERKDLREKAEEMQHQLQRVLVTRGVTATQLGSDVASFGQNADAILKQIAGAKGIPMRILTGSEMGTLASEQDAANFDSRVQDRRTGYAGPKVVRRALDRLIEYGYLPTPTKYEVGWPVEENMDEKGKADFAFQLAMTNKTQGTVVFTDDEIRDMTFDKKPLTPAQKIPVAAPERIDATPGKVDPAQKKDEAQLMAAEIAEVLADESLVETLRQLEAAIESNDLAMIGEILDVEGAHA